MAKKKKLQSTAPVAMTRGQLSRAARERQRIKNLYTAGIAIAALVVLVLGLAIVTTFIIKPNTVVASVNGVNVTRATYNKLRRWDLFQQIQNEAIQQQFGQQSGGTTASSGTDQLQAQLKTVDNDPVDESTLSQIVDNEVLRQKAASDFSVNPSQEDLKASALKDFLPQPTPPATPETPQASATITSTSHITPTATSTPTPGPPTKTPTATSTLPPVPGAQQTAESTYSRYMRAIGQPPSANATDQICATGCPGISESDYLGMIIAPRVLREKVTDKLAATKIMTDVEQIHVAHILTDTPTTQNGPVTDDPVGAKKLHDMLDKGANFAELANKQSADHPKDGDLGWYPKENSGLLPEFINAAWTIPTGKYSEPVKTSAGWHIIKVLERDPKRPLSQDKIDAAKSKLYDDWFAKAKTDSKITGVPSPTPIPTQPVIVEPTHAPSQGTPNSAGTPSSKATTPITNTVPLTNNTSTTNSTSDVGTTPAARPPGETPSAKPNQ